MKVLLDYAVDVDESDHITVGNRLGEGVVITVTSARDQLSVCMPYAQGQDLLGRLISTLPKNAGQISEVKP